MGAWASVSSTGSDGWGDDHGRAVQSREQREMVGERRRDPQLDRGDQFADLDVVAEGLEALLVPLQGRAGEHRQRRQAEHRHTDEVAAPRGPLVRTGDEHPRPVEQRRDVRLLHAAIGSGAGRAVATSVWATGPFGLHWALFSVQTAANEHVSIELVGMVVRVVSSIVVGTWT